ncbi:MAG: undecaprenyl/decaprenyl-phosphate alpha-N-acetylglucosaminyl 1-phosphate transferase [Planctomycetes bacterium]|nr:undecaprenyl/decaprenyl-phosphate alpha-N-acetylglucosaminyl 1-phosphate transferase [Planctomycetota bacterium]
MKTYTAVYFGTVLVAMALVPVVSRLAKRYRIVDAPGPRKVHQTPIPRIGGIAFVVSTLAVVLPVFLLDNQIGQSFRQQQMQIVVLLAAASFLFAVGLIDDLASVRGRTKLLCLIGASLAVCASGATLRSISVGTWFELQTGWAAWPLTVCWIAMITVCMNLIDGLDGLAAGIAAIVCATVALLAYLTDQAAMVVLMLALLGSVTGFLFFNSHPAKIFMGDSGSMFLGFLIGAGSVVCQAKTSTAVGLALPFLALGVPIFDTMFAVARRRVVERRSAFAPDRKHLHHRLLDLGLTQRTVVLVIYAVTLINAGLGVLMLTSESSWTAGLLAGGLLVLLSLFVFLSGDRPYEILRALSRNWKIMQETRMEQRSFEGAQVKMRDAKSFDAWWETLCDMGGRMHFQSIELWSRRNGQSESVRVWYAPVVPSSKAAQLGLPLHANGVAKWEVKASIGVNGCLELGGRQAMLLARLMDEFPPPEPMTETEVLVRTPTGPIEVPRKRTMEAMHYNDGRNAAGRKGDIYSHAAERHGNSGNAL